MKTTILFDLDGTLLPLDHRIFYKEYFRLIKDEMAHVLPEEDLETLIMGATGSMMDDLTGESRNDWSFRREFSRLSGIREELDEVLDAFRRFYRGSFNDMAELVRPADEVAEVLDLSGSKGYDLVLATNAIFPMEAIEARLSWIGVSSSIFSLVTSYEKMRFCKPHREYYMEILRILGRRGSECVMVGNDVQEDMVAKTTGMETFLLEPYLIDRGHPNYVPDHRGDYKDLLRYVESLPHLMGDEDLGG